MEATVLVAKPFLARAQSAEVFGRLWYILGVELEDNSSRWTCAGQGVSAKLGWLEGSWVGKEFYHWLQ